jgi:uncharacterized protein
MAPANLTQDYLKADQEFKAARTPQEKLDALEKMLRLIPKHKGTDHMQADIKRRMKKLKQESGKKSVKAVHSHYVKPEGIGQLFLIGGCNAGKSSLLASLTNAKAEVADFPFSTVMYQPGMMRYVDVWVQLVDMPPISSQGMIPWIPAVVRYGHAALWVINLASDDLLHDAEEVVEILGKGKIKLVPTKEEAGMFDTGVAALYTKIVATHCQDPDAEYRLELLLEMIDNRFEILRSDMDAPETVENLRRPIYEMLGKLRVYTKQPNKPPDLKDPFVIRTGTTVEELAGKIHKDIKSRLDFARIWAEGKYDGQRVARDHVLQEGDIVEIRF